MRRVKEEARWVSGGPGPGREDSEDPEREGFGASEEQQESRWLECGVRKGQ